VIGIQFTHVILESVCQYILAILDFLYKVKNNALCDSHVHSSVCLPACLPACDVLLAPKLMDLFTAWYTSTKTELYWLIMKSTLLIECCVVHYRVHAFQYCFFCLILFCLFILCSPYSSLEMAFTSLGWYVV